MILPIFLNSTPQQNPNIFDCISVQHEIHIPANELPLIGYWIADYQKNEENNPFSFVHQSFINDDSVFASNQDVVLSIANRMFNKSIPLTAKEQDVLYSTLKKSIKSKPTLAGRK